MFYLLDSRNTKKLKTKILSFYKQQSYFSQIISKKAKITFRSRAATSDNFLNTIFNVRVWCNNSHHNSHSQLDMLPIILKEVTPKNDDFLRLKRKECWIRNYQSIEFCAKKHSWTFIYTFCYFFFLKE